MGVTPKAFLLLYNIKLSTVYKVRIVKKLPIVKYLVSCLICHLPLFSITNTNHGGHRPYPWKVGAR